MPDIALAEGPVGTSGPPGAEPSRAGTTNIAFIGADLPAVNAPPRATPEPARRRGR